MARARGTPKNTDEHRMYHQPQDMATCGPLVSTFCRGKDRSAWFDPAWPPVLERRCSSARFARFAGLAPPTAPYSLSETTAEVLEVDDGEDSSCPPQMRKRQPLLVCGRRKQRALFQRRDCLVFPEQQGRNRRRPSFLDVLAPVGEEELFVLLVGHHGQRIPVCHVEEVVEKYLKILSFEI
ncbi:hypothetical protein GWK47_013761 [Chionoecetes opilio]|uniref:Uncharacterized protein n=1 Tax=Chionoecetes opilio TaxID=41210 RepID=A0A8J5C113_CHIOP|nr:hypothetical protein GWK47_013761 [Chionoecetes opilio]